MVRVAEPQVGLTKGKRETNWGDCKEFLEDDEADCHQHKGLQGWYILPTK